MGLLRRALALALLAAAVLAAPARAQSEGAAGAPLPTVILLSFDGTRPSDVGGLPAFARIAAGGAFADSLVPAFPANTFPNHVTFATGVSPDRHGIVNNVFVDPERGRYDYDADPTWIEVEPLWSLAARAGVVSAAYHWVGSEGVWRSGLGPRHWKRFDPSVDEATKVTQILAWLTLPDPSERPRLVTAWFHGADGAGHRTGAGTAAVRATLVAQDAALGVLLDGLAARGLAASTTVVVVSDHGMTDTRRYVDAAAVLARAGVDVEVLGGGGFVQVVCRRRIPRAPAAVAPCAAPAARALRTAGLEAWVRGEGPPEYAIANPRFGDVVAVSPLGTDITRRPPFAGLLAVFGLDPTLRGIHGHRPELPEMHGLFGAIGHGVDAGARPGVVRAVDVAPTVLRLLDLPIPAWMEGHPIPLTTGAQP